NSRFGGYDGLKYTGRVALDRATTVEMTTLDDEWRALGGPRVSCVKLDIEGAEIDALLGARELIEATRPLIFLEWYDENFRCFDRKPEDLLAIAKELRYLVVALPHLVQVHTEALMTLQLQTTA